MRNAADPEQVKEAGRREKELLKRWRADVSFILSTPEGRRFFWGMLEKAGVYRSVWEPSAKIHFNAGQQDFGHWLLAEATAADADSYLLMQREAIQRNNEVHND